MKYFSLLIITIFLVSCGAVMTVDYDAETDFSEYTTYQFYDSINSGLNELDNNRIIRAIDSSFQNRGFERTNGGKFYIDFFANESISNSRNTLGIGVGGGGGNVGVGVSGGIPIGGRTINQRLTIEIFEASEGQKLVWQVIIDGELKEKATPAEKVKYFNKEIAKALQKFPPKKK